MSDRRRNTRFVIPDTTEGSLRLMQDVCVERVTADTIVITNDVPVPQGEALVLELPRQYGSRSIVQVHVASDTPVWVNEVRRHRIELTIRQPMSPEDGGSPAADDPAPSRVAALPAIGVLIRRVTVGVRDVSTAGCLLESTDPLPEGSVALLEVTVNGEWQTETLQICRSMGMAGTPWPWRAGAQFLALSAPAATSVRNLIARFEIIDELRAMPEKLVRAPRPGSLNSERPTDISKSFDAAQGLAFDSAQGMAENP
jgi:hypothetical protein